jgi:general secretion pathway protein A
MVLTGDAGTGKTTLVRKLLLSIPIECAQFSVIVNPALNRSELLECILMDFGVKEIPSSKALRLSLFKDLLLRAYGNGQTSVLLIDEAHLLTAELIDEVRLLSNFETAEQKLLQIVLVGQSELNTVLQLDSMRQVKQRLAIRVNIGPLSPVDVEHYIETRWKRAGASTSHPFSMEAVELIAAASAGIPRVINVICDAALVNVYGAGRSAVGRREIESVVVDLQLGVPPPVTGAAVQPQTNVSFSEAVRSNHSPDRRSSGIKSLEKYFPEPERTPRLQRLAHWFGVAHSKSR